MKATRDEMAEAVTEVRHFLNSEVTRARRTLKDGKWDTMLVGVSDLGELTLHPCRLLLPFHYPATIGELDDEMPDHFEFAERMLKNPNWQPDKAELDGGDVAELQRYFGNHAFPSYRNASRIWSVPSHDVRLFKKLYDRLDDQEGLEFEKASAQLKSVQLQILQEACAEFDSEQTIIGIESESEEWWEVLTFHIHGPPIPPPPPRFQMFNSFVACAGKRTTTSVSLRLPSYAGASPRFASTVHVPRTRQLIC